MAEQVTGGSKGKGKKVGRSKRHPSHVNYTMSHKRERNKIKRVLKSNGLKAAEEYSKKYGVRMPNVSGSSL
jgi:hypothetical protein